MIRRCLSWEREEGRTRRHRERRYVGRQLSGGRLLFHQRVGWAMPPRGAPARPRAPERLEARAAAPGYWAGRATGAAGAGRGPAPSASSYARAPVIDDVVVEQLEVAGPELHGEGQLLADHGVEIERLVLGRGERGYAGQLLRRLHEGARVLRRELALVRSRTAAARRLRARRRAPRPGGSASSPGRAARGDRAAGRGWPWPRSPRSRSGSSPPARAWRTHRSVTTSQRSVWKRSGPLERAFDRDERPSVASAERLLDFTIKPVLVPDLADELALRVLVAGAAQMGAHAPVEILQAPPASNGPREMPRRSTKPRPFSSSSSTRRQVPRKRRQREIRPGRSSARRGRAARGCGARRPSRRPPAAARARSSPSTAPCRCPATLRVQPSAPRSGRSRLLLSRRPPRTRGRCGETRPAGRGGASARPRRCPRRRVTKGLDAAILGRVARLALLPVQEKGRDSRSATTRTRCPGRACRTEARRARSCRTSSYRCRPRSD